jgi:hypothetical protein
MEEVCIKFETSKLAKEKNFHWDQLILPDYKIIKGVKLPRGGYTCYDKNGKEICPKRYNANNFHYSRPTQALLAKWLREVHNIHIEIHYFTNQPVGDENWEHAYQCFIDNKDIHLYFKTYEKALEVGLFNALKLIK